MTDQTTPVLPPEQETYPAGGLFDIWLDVIAAQGELTGIDEPTDEPDKSCWNALMKALGRADDKLQALGAVTNRSMDLAAILVDHAARVEAADAIKAAFIERQSPVVALTEAGNWQQYAKEGETAQAVIERLWWIYQKKNWARVFFTATSPGLMRKLSHGGTVEIYVAKEEPVALFKLTNEYGGITRTAIRSETLYHMVALHEELQAAGRLEKASQVAPVAEEGEIRFTYCGDVLVAVTRQDGDFQILKVLWEIPADQFAAMKAAGHVNSAVQRAVDIDAALGIDRTALPTQVSAAPPALPVVTHVVMVPRGGFPWRVGLFWSSSNPKETVRCLAEGEGEIADYEKRGDFIEWLTPVQAAQHPKFAAQTSAAVSDWSAATEENPLADLWLTLKASTGYEVDSHYKNITPERYGEVVAALEGRVSATVGANPGAPENWRDPHPPTRHCMCPSCIPSFDDRFSAAVVAVPEDLLEAVDTLLEQEPCDCPHKMRYERGEHLSNCHLFDLNLERNRMLSPPERLKQNTNCWDCQAEYGKSLSECPLCFAANANTNCDLANKQLNAVASGSDVP